MSLHKCYFLSITTHKYYKYASVVVTCSNKNTKQPCQELSPHLDVFTSPLKNLVHYGSAMEHALVTMPCKWMCFIKKIININGCWPWRSTADKVTDKISRSRSTVWQSHWQTYYVKNIIITCVSTHCPTWFNLHHTVQPLTSKDSMIQVSIVFFYTLMQANVHTKMHAWSPGGLSLQRKP